MELNEINESYKKQEAKVKKVDTAKTKQTIESMRKQVVALTDELEDLQVKKSRAERDKDSATVKTTEQEIKTKQGQLKTVRGNLKKLEETLSKAKTELDGHIKLVEEMAKSNPELKAELDAALKTKFDRAVKRNKAEIEKLSKQVEPTRIIRNAANKDPNVMYLIKDIEKQTKTIKDQEAILADPNKSNEEKSKAQATLDSAKQTLESSRSSLASYFKGTIKREDIDRIQSLAGMDKEIKLTDRRISGLDKQNENYETAIRNIEKAKEEKEEDKGDGKGSKSGKGDKGGLPATKPKWYQFIKRFKNWYHKDDPVPSKDEEEEPEKTDDDSKKSFKDSMKYDVVRDYKDKLEQQYLKDAKAQNKEAREEASKEDGPEL